jgi:hypothetical protein
MTRFGSCPTVVPDPPLSSPGLGRLHLGLESIPIVRTFVPSWAACRIADLAREGKPLHFALTALTCAFASKSGSWAG